MSLRVRAAQLYTDNHTAELFRLASERWPRVDAELEEGLDELCRFAFIRARDSDLVIDTEVYYARAIVAAVIRGARDTAACLIMRQFFTAMEHCRRGNGGGDGYEKARGILDEMRRLVSEEDPAWASLVARLYYDKTAVVYLLEATGGSGGKPRPGAEATLTMARKYLEYARPYGSGKLRDRLKIDGQLALVGYLLGSYNLEQQEEVQREALRNTNTVLNEAREARLTDVVGWAEANRDVMTLGEYIGWIPYEVL
ncbi:MAG: hypothetical protein AB1806_09515 [Acidobacteriota bacterium]